MRNTILDKLNVISSCEMQMSEEITKEDETTNLKWLTKIKHLMTVTAADVAQAYDNMYESKLFLLISNLPRTHFLVLKSIYHCYKFPAATKKQAATGKESAIGLKETEIL